MNPVCQCAMESENKNDLFLSPVITGWSQEKVTFFKKVF
jgi:hypothetical protein